MFCFLATVNCASNPCENGATCVDEPSGFQCNCATPWEGQFCTIGKYHLHVGFKAVVQSVLGWPAFSLWLSSTWSCPWRPLH